MTSPANSHPATAATATGTDLPEHTIGKYTRTKADTGGFGGAGTFWFCEWTENGKLVTGNEHTTKRAALAEFVKFMKLDGRI